MVEGLRKKGRDDERLAHGLKHIARKRMLRHEWAIFVLNLLNTSASLGVPCWVLHATQVRAFSEWVGVHWSFVLTSFVLVPHTRHPHTCRPHTRHPQAEPGPGFVLTSFAIVTWMKLVSYAHCNWDLRLAHRENQLRPGERGAPDADPS